MFVIYYFKLKDTKPFKIPRGYVFCFQVYIEFIHNLVLQILGPKFEKITPFFIYLFSYIFVSNTISIFGFVNPTESLTITLSLAFVT
jgi:F-type H+-transporting ATPase subunit a